MKLSFLEIQQRLLELEEEIESLTESGQAVESVRYGERVVSVLVEVEVVVAGGSLVVEDTELFAVDVA